MPEIGQERPLFALDESSVFVQGLQQSRELATYRLMVFAHLLVLASEIDVGLVVYLMLGMGRTVPSAISSMLVLMDLSLMMGDLGFVRRNVLLMLQQTRLMFVELGLNASQSGEQITVLDAPTAMLR
jgi:hypothetical protein